LIAPFISTLEIPKTFAVCRSTVGGKRREGDKKKHAGLQGTAIFIQLFVYLGSFLHQFGLRITTTWTLV
jgi:hypothetical protein